MVKNMLTLGSLGVFVDGKCYHIWHTYGSVMGMVNHLASENGDPLDFTISTHDVPIAIPVMVPVCMDVYG